MLVDKTILISLGVIIGIYLMYKLFLGRPRIENKFEKNYEKILTSDEYKVKGQYEK